MSPVTLATRITALCILSVLGGSSVALEESQSSITHNQFASPADYGYARFPVKRAYSYVSEYKRLPVYNFGLGKRSITGYDDKRTQPYSFGIGKRLNKYQFGLGKREDYSDLDSRMTLDELSNNLIENFARSERAAALFRMDKKKPRYDFGLGKRNNADSDSASAEDSLGEKKLANLLGLQKSFFDETQEDSTA